MTLARIQRDEIPSPAISVSLAICPPTSAVPHIFYRVRLRKARLARYAQIEADPGIPNPSNPPPYFNIVAKEIDKRLKAMCVILPVCLKRLNFIRYKRYNPIKNNFAQENIENIPIAISCLYENPPCSFTVLFIPFSMALKSFHYLNTNIWSPTFTS